MTTEQLEDMLRDYPNLNERIKNRVAEIRNPYSPADENIGGGRSNNGNGAEKSLVGQIDTIDTDEDIQNWKARKECIEQSLIACDSIYDDLLSSQLIDVLYFHFERYKIPYLAKHKTLALSQDAMYKRYHRFMSILSDCVDNNNSIIIQ